MRLAPTERATLYRLCAHLLTREPDATTREVLGVPGAREVLCDAEPELAAWLDGVGLDAGPEFARLFLVPKGVPPYASAWLEGERDPLAEQLATATHRAMEALHMQQTKLHGHLSLDHAGLLLALAAEALDHPDTAGVAIGEHVEATLLGPWTPAFTDALARRARHPLYRALAQLIRATVPLEAS